MQMEYIGNRELLNRHKIAFLCSRTVTSGAILRCYDWATKINDKTKVIIGGFQSKIEKDVLHFLLKGKQAVIMVIARQMYKELPIELISLMDEGRLLIISTSPKSIRVSKKTAYQRNMFIVQIADEVVFGYISKESTLNDLYKMFCKKSQILYTKSNLSSKTLG